MGETKEKIKQHKFRMIEPVCFDYYFLYSQIELSELNEPVIKSNGKQKEKEFDEDI